MYEELQRLPKAGAATMVGYLLKNTVSCPRHRVPGRVPREGRRSSRDIQRDAEDPALLPDGTIAGRGHRTRCWTPDTVVSMNFWGFTPADLRRAGDVFRRLPPQRGGADDVKAECLLPTMVGDLLAAGTS